MKIAMVGVGAVGTVAAISLARRSSSAGDLTLCVRTSPSRLVVRGAGAAAFETRAFRSVVEPVDATPAELVVVATKTHQTAGAAPWLDAVVGPGSTVVVLQNGVEHVERLAPLVPAGTRIVPAVVDLPARRAGVGEVEVDRAGSVVFPADAEDVAARFDPLGGLLVCTTTVDFELVRWRKLAVNVISGAIPTLTDRPAGVFREPEVQKLAEALVAECVAVARATGVTLPEGLEREIVTGFFGARPDAVNSMLADRRAGRRLEGEARNGAVARLGATLGLDCPYNRMAAVLLDAINQDRDDESG